MTFETIPVRSATAAQWADTNPADGAAAPLLEAGEFGIESDTGKIRVGDGTTSFANLKAVRPAKVQNVTLVAGSKVVNDTSITANTVVAVILKTLGTITGPKAVACTSRVAGTSFTITSADNTDTSTYQVITYEP